MSTDPHSFHLYLPVDPFTLKVGKNLGPWVEDIGEKKKSRFIDEFIPLVRNGIFYELGLPLPPITVREYEAEELDPDTYEVLIDENPVMKGKIPLGRFAVRAEKEFLEKEKIDFIADTHPIDGTQIFWIPEFHPTRNFMKLAAEEKWGQWDAAEFLTVVLSKVAREQSDRFLNLAAVYEIVETFRKVHPNLAADVLREKVTMITLADVLKILVKDKVGIRSLDAIFEAIARHGNLEMKAETLASLIKGWLTSLGKIESEPAFPSCRPQDLPKAPVDGKGEPSRLTDLSPSPASRGDINIKK